MKKPRPNLNKELRELRRRQDGLSSRQGEIILALQEMQLENTRINNRIAQVLSNNDVGELFAHKYHSTIVCDSAN